MQIFLLGIKGKTPNRHNMLLISGSYVENGAYYVKVSNDGKTITCEDFPSKDIIGTYLMDVPKEMCRGGYQDIFERMNPLIDEEFKKQYPV